MQEDQVRDFCSGGVSDYRVRDGKLPLPVVQVGARAIPGEIVKTAGTGQAPDFSSPKMPFDAAEAQATDVSHVDPGPQHGQDVGLLKLRDRLDKFKLT